MKYLELNSEIITYLNCQPIAKEELKGKIVALNTSILKTRNIENE